LPAIFVTGLDVRPVLKIFVIFELVDCLEVDSSGEDGLKLDCSGVGLLEIDGFLPNELNFGGTLKIDGLKVDGNRGRPAATLQTKEMRKCNFIRNFLDS